MQTASGNKSGHILALIAVGFSAVADVCCCLWLHPVRGLVSVAAVWMPRYWFLALLSWRIQPV